MGHTLSVVVQVDLEAQYVHLVVTGCLTELNHRGLTPLVRRARTLVPGVTVNIDLTGAHRVDQAALDLLQWSVDHTTEPGGPVHVLTRPVPFGFPGGAAMHAPEYWGAADLDGVAA